ncbi:MAG TPA: chalcone isomerase family protein [Myxococcota bacterium]|jgi:hypothetical protein|nr:chalcone isomerase family protein [Myxococcota bacterium]
MTRKSLRACGLALVLALASGVAARALEVEGIDFPAQIEVAPGAPPLVLSGAGVRSRFMLDVYAIGLYLPARASSADAAIAAPGRKRVVIHMLRDVEAQQFVEALETSLRGNHDEATMRKLQPSIAQLESAVGPGTVKEGTRIELDFLPGSGTRVSFDGKTRGAPIGDEAFFPALLRNWLGAKPVSEDLKRELLGAS